MLKAVTEWRSHSVVLIVGNLYSKDGRKEGIVTRYLQADAAILDIVA
jgi:hypothetical protein